MIRRGGIVLIAVALLLPLIWFVPLATKNDPVAVFSQYLGSAALIGMGIVQFLGTRTRWSQVIFGPLDRIYELHKWLAVGSIAAAALHDTIDADMEGGRETVLVRIAETAGELSFYGLLLLTFATVIPFIPYHYWRFSHKFIGAFFALAAFHYAFILKPFALSDPVGLYVLAFCVLGIVSYLYMLLLHAILPAPHSYRVSAVETSGDVTEITLTPDGRGLRHKPGQFAFVSFDTPALREVHPFTISGAPQPDRSLRFAVKGLGDYTSKLAALLEPGQRARVRGAYGGFLRPQDSAPQIWIGAGIGITPFLSWARSLEGRLPHRATLYYCAPDARAPFIEELRAIADRLDGLTLHIVTRAEGRLTAERIAAEAGETLGTARVFFCGPAAMREALAEGLAARGMAPARFHYEMFEIRSGIGLRALLGWLAEKLGQRLATPPAAAEPPRPASPAPTPPSAG